MGRAILRAAASLVLSAFLGVGAAAHSDLCELLLMPPALYDHPANDVEREYMSLSDVSAYCGTTGSAALLDAVVLGCTNCHFHECTEYLPTPGEDGISVDDEACVIRHEDGHVNSDRETGDPNSDHFGWF